MTCEIILSAPDTDEVLRYMGMPPERADESTRTLAVRCGQQLLSVAAPRWCGQVFDLSVEPGGVRLDGNFLLGGQELKAHLDGCARAVVFCATLGADVDALIRRTQYTDMAQALALDCAAGALVEQLCDRIEEYIHAQLPGLHSPYRYSPGYGDLPLGVQCALLDALDAHRLIGLSATDSCILTPRKSVTAILGLSDSPIPAHKRSCILCPNADNCQLRKSGGHCGI